MPHRRVACTVFCKVAKQEFPSFLSKAKKPYKFLTYVAKYILGYFYFGDDETEDELKDDSRSHQPPVDCSSIAGTKVGKAYNEQQTGHGPEIIHATLLEWRNV